MQSFSDICDKVVQNVENRTQKPNSSASSSYGSFNASKQASSRGRSYNVPNYGRPSVPEGYKSESPAEREARRKKELRDKYSRYDEASS